jgi:Protein of unknown function (DUF5818)
MLKTLMCVLILITSAAWLQAQQSAKTSGSHTMAGETQVEGCLHAANGSYTLTDKSGTVYHLEGDSAKLAEHIGHEVEITGTAANSGTSATRTSTSGEMERTLDVKDVKHISKTCKMAAAK